MKILLSKSPGFVAAKTLRVLLMAWLVLIFSSSRCDFLAGFGSANK